MRAKELAIAHWKFVRDLVRVEHGDLDSSDIVALSFDDYLARLAFMYVEAFIHGYKHAIEDYQGGKNEREIK